MASVSGFRVAVASSFKLGQLLPLPESNAMGRDLQRKFPMSSGRPASKPGMADDVSINTARPNAHEIFEQAAENGRDELKRSTHALAISGLAGGLTMGLTGMSVAIVRALLPAGPLTDFFSY